MRRHLNLPVSLNVIRTVLLTLMMGSLLLAPQDSAAQRSGRLAGLASSRALGLSAAFTFTPLYPVVGQNIHFEDFSMGDIVSWHWDFGDGWTSARQSTWHSYKTGGFKKVTLIVKTRTESRTMSKTITVLPGAAASFAFSPTVPAPGQFVQFKDTTSGTPTSWKWSFGDGGTSSAEDPQHAYAKAGSFNVTLITEDGSRPHTASRTITVGSMSVLSSSFTFAPALPVVGQVVQFQDTSTGSPSSWLWNFGDGTTSTTQNPTHAYTSTGTKTVTLTATGGTASKTASRVLTIGATRTAAFTYTPASPTAGQAVQFTDLSTITPRTWLWNFGDASTSTSPNPSHAFGAAGSFSVLLTITDDAGSLTATQTVTVTGGLTAKFTYSPAAPAAGQAVQFTDESTGSPTSWLWDFNDGSKSSDPNPSRVFASSGRYNVTLLASNASGSGNTSATVMIGAGDGSTGSYWVSPTGAAAWIAARSETPLDGSACCSLATANANTAPGDIVYLRGGTYGTGIKPSKSGVQGNIITFAAFPGETPMITARSARAVTIIGKNYIKVDGIHSYESGAFFLISRGSCNNEITNCVFDKSSGWYSLGLICNIEIADPAYPGSNNNWIHGNVFSRYGWIGAATSSDNGTVRINAGHDDPSSHNTFEDNVFSHGGHDCIDVGGMYNVVKNNVFHNDETYFAVLSSGSKNLPASGYFGNRNVHVTNYGNGVGTANHTLIEGNRIGYAGTPPDDDGSNGIENAGYHTVARFNDMYGNGCAGYYGKMMKTYNSAVRSGSLARVYNNTIYANGFGDLSLGTGYKYGVTIWSYSTYDDWPEKVVVMNNIVYGNRAEWKVGSENIRPQVTYENNYNLDPGFVNTDMSDKTSLVLPDLRLLPSSPCINLGRHLTEARGGSGANDTTLVVSDALFFQDGSWGSALTHQVTHFPDRIAIGSVANIAEIASVDYKTNTIILTTPMTWADGAKIWLFSDSGGKRVLNGTAPDIGAHEYDER